jgi:Undecaprenyl-phosphate galactose phosphotransferase WbaP
MSFQLIPWTRLRPVLALTLADSAALLTAGALGVASRLVVNPELPVPLYVALWPFVPLMLVLFAFNRLYAAMPSGPSSELRSIAASATSGFLLLAAWTFLTKEGEAYSRAAFVLAWAASIVLVPIFRGMVRWWFARQTWWTSPAVVLGAGRTAELLLHNLQRNPWLGLRATAVFDDDVAKHGTTLAGVPVVGSIEAAPAWAESNHVRHAVVAMPGAAPERLAQLWRDLGHEFPHLIVIPGLVGFASLWVEAKDIAGILGLEVRQRLLLPWPRLVKRVLDVVMCVLAAPFVGLLLLILAGLIKLDGGKVFYSQKRIGRDGRPFQAWKFRSMVPDADAALRRILDENPSLRQEWERDHKLKVDPRITWIGRILRKTSLDELPQTWNILCGDMSWVGPRPVTQPELDRYGEHGQLYRRVRPGLTGLWQVSGRNLTTYEERVALDAYYVRNWSVWLDVFIIAKTVRVALRGEGAY